MKSNLEIRLDYALFLVLKVIQVVKDGMDCLPVVELPVVMRVPREPLLNDPSCLYQGAGRESTPPLPKSQSIGQI